MLIGITMTCVKTIEDTIDNQRRRNGFIVISLTISFVLPGNNSRMIDPHFDRREPAFDFKAFPPDMQESFILALIRRVDL